MVVGPEKKKFCELTWLDHCLKAGALVDFMCKGQIRLMTAWWTRRGALGRAGELLS
jgi:hypothetical protein